MKMPNNTVRGSVEFIKQNLGDLFSDSELNQTIEILFDHYCQLSKMDLLLNSDKVLVESERIKITEAVDQLRDHKPLAYIIGEWEFYGLRFLVNEHTLIPRLETEELVQLILNENTQGKVLDIGTGTGCIAISLKKNNPAFMVSAWDVDAQALSMASNNASQLNTAVYFEQVNALNLEGREEAERYDIIVSNPPYIGESEKDVMASNVLDYEPELALFVPDEKPLQFYEAIADFSSQNLVKGGRLYFEINENYGLETKALLEAKNFQEVKIIQDINGRDRMVKATLVD